MSFAPRLLAAVALGLPIASIAGPSDYIYYPNFEYGERELDFKYGTAKAKDSPRDEQNHRIGPALLGKVKLGAREAIRYNAALLLGETHAAPRHTFRLQAEYEF